VAGKRSFTADAIGQERSSVKVCFCDVAMPDGIASPDWIGLRGTHLMATATSKAGRRLVSGLAQGQDGRRVQQLPERQSWAAEAVLFTRSPLSQFAPGLFAVRRCARPWALLCYL